jgi:hypothetical protein
MNKWKIFTFIFAFLFLIMLVVNISIRQDVISTDDQYDEYYKEVTIYDNFSTIKPNYMEGMSFVLYSNNQINLDFYSDNFANVYLLRDTEYLRYDQGEDFYYIEMSENSDKLTLTGKELPAGEYYFIVESNEEPVGYHIKITAQPI